MVISRRVFLATGAVLVAAGGVLAGARATHRLDDLAEAVGLEPKPQSDPADDRLLASAATAQAALLASVEATAARHTSLALQPFVAIGREQLDALGGSTASTDVAAVPEDASAALTALALAYRTQSTQRADDAVAAASPELARVLASMSAGLTQCARTVGAA